MLNLFKRDKKVTVDSVLQVKGWSDSFLAPTILYVPDLEVAKYGEKTVETMITHCDIKPGSPLEDMVIKEVKKNHNLSDGDLIKYSSACCFAYAIVVNKKFKKLSNKQKLVLLLLEAYRAEGYYLNGIPVLRGLTNGEIVDRAAALVHATDLFGKMAVSGALKKQRKVFDNSCYRASSHKLFQKAPKEKIYTDRFLSQVEQAVAEEAEAEQTVEAEKTAEQPTPTPEPTAEETKTSITNKGKGKGAA